MANRDAILEALQETVPGFEYALREPFDDYRYLPPKTVWDRIKTLVYGPPMTRRLGELEVAVINKEGKKLSDTQREKLIIKLEEVRPVGVKVLLLEFHG